MSDKSIPYAGFLAILDSQDPAKIAAKKRKLALQKQFGKGFSGLRKKKGQA